MKVNDISGQKSNGAHPLCHPKRKVFFLRLVVVAFCSIVIAQTTFDFLTCSGHIGGDFILRYNEVNCLQSGINPFNIWSGRVQDSSYKSLGQSDNSGGRKSVHAYPPWEYTFFMPFSWLPLQSAAWLFFLLETIATIIAARYLFQLGKSFRNRYLDGVFVMACGLFLGAAVHAALRRGQFSLLNVALLVVMVKSLDTNRQMIAGLCWALIMSKPQVGLLLFVPLLLGQKFITIATAVSACFLASIPPAVLCHESPVSMILSLQESGGNVLGSTTLLSPPVFAFLSSRVHPAFPGLTSAGFGLALCIWLSWLHRHHSSWLFRLAPAILCSTAWTYLQLYDKTLILFPQAILAVFILQETNRKKLVSMLLMIFLSATSLGFYIHPRTDTWFRDLGLIVSNECIGQWLYGTYVIGSFFQFIFFAIFFAKSSDRNQSDQQSVFGTSRFHQLFYRHQSSCKSLPK